MEKEKIAFIKKTLEEYRLSFELYLGDSLEIRKEGVPLKLHECMDYSLNAGGKRIRPILCLASAERCGCSLSDAMPLALGLEMLHTATLIHDDLPCMDNDDMRRGKPSNHAVFGETLAVLAGDALLAQSIEYPLLQTKNISHGKLINAMKIFSRAIGPAGVCGGQVLDMYTPISEANPDYVRKIAALKTGTLIRAAILSGAALGTESADTLDCYYNYGTHLGSAFQIVDDILDVMSTAEELGKTPGKDSDQGKITHVTVYGLEQASKMAQEESLLAKEAILKVLPEDDFLVMLADYLLYRTY